MPENRDEFIRKRIARQKRIKRRRLKILFVFLLIVAILVGILLSLTVFFKIEKVTASGSGVYTATEIVAAADISNEENLFLISKADTLEKIKKKLPYVEDITIEKSLPNEINIKVKDAVTIYTIKQGTEYYKVSSSGNVLEKSPNPPENTVLVSGCKFSGEVGDKIVYENEKEAEALTLIMDELEKKNISLEYIDFSTPISLNIGVENKFKVKLGLKINLKEKLNHLEETLEALKNENFGIIDISMWSNSHRESTFIAEKP